MSTLSNIAERMAFWRNGTTPPTNYKLGDPIKDIIRRETAKLEYTRDAAILSQYNLIPVFIYGTLMEKYPEAELISQFNDMPTLVAFTYDNFYCMKKKLGSLSFPIAMEPNGEQKFTFSPPRTVKGQLFFLPPEAFYTLDKRFRNGLQFDRKMVSVCAFNREKKKELKLIEYAFEAFMYIGKPEHWEKQFDGGYWFEPVQVMEPNKYYTVPYYFFLFENGDPIQEEPETTPTKETRLVSRWQVVDGELENVITSEEYEHQNYHAPAVAMPGAKEKIDK